MLKSLLSLYSWRYPAAVVYMLQSTEYQVRPYLRWYWQTNNFSQVMYRRVLDPTKAARLLLLAMRLGIIVQLLVGLGLIAGWQWGHLTGGLYFGLAVIVSYPLIWAHAITLPLVLGRLLIVAPRHRMYIKESEAIFRAHPGVKLAIAGSYGKTSMKELLLTVLQEGKKVAATPANKNVSISHAYFAKKLTGDEEVIIIEYGEGAPGDVERFAHITHPTHAIITGIAPAHLDRYKTVQRASEDIFSVSEVVAAQQVYVNEESELAKRAMRKKQQGYSDKGALGWKVAHITVGLHGTSFTLKKGKRSLGLHSGLVGRHQVGPLALVAALAAELGLTDEQIEKGIAHTMPFEHRMQPYELDGAWIIDDTYNGNIEGIRAGTKLLAELPAKRKIYITPGLVDQGREAASVHQQMGELIAAAQPDTVVLMENSATLDISKGLQDAGFAGELLVENNPLDFYTNINTFVASGDVVLMQNDWTDNYA